jgi:polyhydroxybutyrate depolymerase
MVRSYRLYVPPSYQPGRPAPLLFNLHGYGSTSLSQEQSGDFRAIADTAGFLIVHPNGTIDPGTSYQYWNVWNQAGGPDDTAFLAALADTLARRYTLDPDRLYSAGYSNGGFMSYELACHLSARVAAVASVCGSMATVHFGTCRPAHPTPVMEIHGTGDTNVIYNGGSWFVPVPAVLDYWVQANSCLAMPTVTVVPDTDPTDHSTAEHSVWRGYRVGAVVEHFRIVNGGHVWPGGPPSSTDVVNRDISASQEIWRFLRRYRLSQLALAPPAVTVLRAYPNPATGAEQLLVQAGTSLRPEQLRVCNALGQHLLVQAAAGPDGTVRVETSQWAPGVYVLYVRSGPLQGQAVRVVK